jgi:hypothetical protein
LFSKERLNHGMAALNRKLAILLLHVAALALALSATRCLARELGRDAAMELTQSPETSPDSPAASYSKFAIDSVVPSDINPSIDSLTNLAANFFEEPMVGLPDAPSVPDSASLAHASHIAALKPRQPLPYRGLSFAITYSFAAGNNLQLSQILLQGGSAEISAPFWKGLGVAASVIGMHGSNIGYGVPLNFVTTTFGPRYNWTPALKVRDHSMLVFAECLLGEADGFRGVYPATNGSIDSTNSLALQLGGGVDLYRSEHLSFRVLQADWLRTQFANSGDNVQNNLRIGVGIVLRLPRQ